MNLKKTTILNTSKNITQDFFIYELASTNAKENFLISCEGENSVFSTTNTINFNGFFKPEYVTFIIKNEPTNIPNLLHRRSSDFYKIYLNDNDYIQFYIVNEIVNNGINQNDIISISNNYTIYGKLIRNNIEYEITHENYNGFDYNILSTPLIDGKLDSNITEYIWNINLSYSNIIFTMLNNRIYISAVTQFFYSPVGTTLKPPSQQNLTKTLNGIFNVEIKEITDNSQGEDSSEGGGDGEYDDESDSIGVPDLPVFDFLGGVITMWLLNSGNYQSFGQYLWGNDFETTLKKLLVAPLECVIDIINIPISGELLTLGSSTDLKLGNIINTGVSAQPVLKQYIQLNCGNINIKNYSNTFLDYAPNTEISLYLPFVGDVPIEISDVMGGVLNVVYNIDLLTGSSICFVRVINDGYDNVIYSYSCNVATKVPLTSADFSSLYASALSVASSTAIGTVTGGVGGAVINGSMAAAGNIANSKPTYSKTNAMSGANGLMGIKKPFVKITRAIQQRPKDFNNFEGYTLEVTKNLSELTGFGYTVASKFNLQGINATDEELDMIETLLKEGVIL